MCEPGRKPKATTPEDCGRMTDQPAAAGTREPSCHPIIRICFGHIFDDNITTSQRLAAEEISFSEGSRFRFRCLLC